MLIGAIRLLEDYGSAAKIAEAMIEGKCSSEYARYVVDDLILKAAKMRIELHRDSELKALRGYILNVAHTTPSYGAAAILVKDAKKLKKKYKWS